jgi:hypothetical protein
MRSLEVSAGCTYRRNAMTSFQPGDRVRLIRRWTPELKRRDNVADLTIVGTVESWSQIADHPEIGGYLTLMDVPHEYRGGWAAPSADCNQTTTLVLVEPAAR